MGDVGEFLRELPSKVAEYEEIINSVRLFKYTCSKRFDVIQLEQLRQRMQTEELPLLEKLWEATKLMDRFVKHHGSNYNIQPTINALHKFAPLFQEKGVLGTPKIIQLSRLQLKSLPKDHYEWQRFNKLFELEKKLLDKSKSVRTQPIRHTTTGFLTALSGKNKAIILVVLIMLIGGGFSSLWAKDNKNAGTENQKVTYYTGQSLNGTVYRLEITEFADGSRIIKDLENRAREGTIEINSAGYTRDGSLFVFASGYVEVHNYLSPKEIIKLWENQPSNSGITNNDMAGSYFKKGKEYFDSKDFVRAIDQFNQAISLDGNGEYILWKSKAYFEQGKQFYDSKDYEKARENFESAIKLNDKESEYYKWLGNSYLFLEMYDKAKSDYELAISLNPDDYESLKSLGSAYYYLGDKEKACEFWKKAVNLGNIKASEYVKKYC